VSISSLLITTAGKSCASRIRAEVKIRKGNEINKVYHNPEGSSIYTSEFSGSLADIDPSMGVMWAQIFGPRDIVVKESNPRLDAQPVVAKEYEEFS
jgi:hypothetical protein